MPNSTEPPAPLPERGVAGLEGEEGTTDGLGGAGGHGGRGGRGGIGLQGIQGEQGIRGFRGATGTTGADGVAGADGIAGLQGKQGETGGERGETGATGADGKRGATGPLAVVQSRMDKYALFIVVLVTALSAIYFATNAQHKLSEANSARSDLLQSQQEFAHQIDCQQAAFEQTTAALQARGTFAEIQAHALLNLDRSQKRYLNTVRTTLTRQQGLAALAKYQKALQFSISATRDQLKIRARHHFTSPTAVKQCR